MHTLTEGLLAKLVYRHYDNDDKNDDGVALNNNIHCSKMGRLYVCVQNMMLHII